MVHILYRRGQHYLRLWGHADGGPVGKDPVCAGVSALTLTLAYNVAQLVTQECAEQPQIRLEPGDSAIRCKSRGRSGPAVTLMFDTVCAGFALLQTLYPDKIHYRITD